MNELSKKFYAISNLLMASRIYLEFQQLPEERKSLLTRHKNRSTSRTEPKTLKNFVTTPRDIENTQISPVKTSQRFLEVRRISYQSIRIHTQKNTESPMSGKSGLRPASTRSERTSSYSVSKREIRTFHISKPASQEEFDSIPATEGKTYYNERIRWSKRKKGHQPICIINFNGIIGDYSKATCWSSETGKFCLVDGARAGLKLLSNEFYIVILSWFSREITKSLLGLFDNESLFADAVYIVRHRKLKHRFRHNYTQIYEDFKMQNVPSSVVVVSSIVLTRDELAMRKGLEIFYEPSLSGCNKYSTIGLPIACSDDKGMPFCVLVPHYRLSDEHISMLDLARFVLERKKMCTGDFAMAGCDGEVKLPCEHQEIPLIPLHPKEYEGCGTKYVLFMQYLVKKNRPPMSRRIPRIKNL